jgi:hypothetical protein
MNESAALELREVVSLLQEVVKAAGVEAAQTLTPMRAGYLLERLAGSEGDGLETFLLDELKHALQV